MNSLIKDLSVLTTIPEGSINKLFNKIPYCICDYIQNSRFNGDATTEIDIGIGNIYVNVDEESISYKFVPNTYLEENIKRTVRENKNPLQLKLEESLINRITHAYKDMF